MAFYTNQALDKVNREVRTWSFTLEDDGPARWDMLGPYAAKAKRAEEAVTANKNPLNVERERPISSDDIMGRARVPQIHTAYSSQGAVDTIEQKSTSSYLRALDFAGVKE